MPRRTYGSVVRNSLRSESSLVQARDTMALFEKKYTPLRWRLPFLFARQLSYTEKEGVDPAALEIGKLFGSLVLDVAGLPTNAHDKTSGSIAIERGERVIGLHFAGLEPRLGYQGLMRDLQTAAEFTKTIPNPPENVASLTHLEFGRLAARLGFDTLDASDTEPRTAHRLTIQHDILNLYNKHDKPLVPTVITMPTENFIAKYGQS